MDIENTATVGKVVAWSYLPYLECAYMYEERQNGTYIGREIHGRQIRILQA